MQARASRSLLTPNAVVILPMKDLCTRFAEVRILREPNSGKLILISPRQRSEGQHPQVKGQ
jgi:hypothetical protein